jgi:hypothetical protein
VKLPAAQRHQEPVREAATLACARERASRQDIARSAAEQSQMEIGDGGVVSELTNVDAASTNILSDEVSAALAEPVRRQRHAEQAQRSTADQSVTHEYEQSTARDLDSYVT